MKGERKKERKGETKKEEEKERKGERKKERKKERKGESKKKRKKGTNNKMEGFNNVKYSNRPSGNLIASAQLQNSLWSIVFFERNGLRHGDFTLPFNSETLKVGNSY